MDKQSLIGIIICIIGIVLFICVLNISSAALGTSLAVLALGLSIVITSLLGKRWNWKMYLAILLIMFGISASCATLSYADKKPFISMIILLMIGLALFIMNMLKSKSISKSPANKTSMSKQNFFGWISIACLIIISLLLIPTINWSHPKDPAGVMILSLLTACLASYALLKNHRSKMQIIIASYIFIINFALIRAYESGVTDFLGKFYRLFIPLYEALDPIAQTIEYALIALTVILILFLSYKKTKVNDYTNKTLWYFVLMPFLAIFLFEMMGLPAGFLEGNTTRSDLLVTDTNAAMSTIGMLFIAVLCYICFNLFPFWVSPIIAGIWWVFWKPWLLHHPDPALFTSLQSFLPAGLFLFFTGIKRVTLPMIIIILVLQLSKKK